MLAGLAAEPLAWVIALGLGLALVALSALRRPPEAARALCFTLGFTLALTAPLGGLLDRAWLGSFPTIDKEGSLLFYLDGVHVRALLHPIAALQDPAVQLIGVHLGHLWPVAALDALGLSAMGAFNAVGLLSIAGAWWAAWLLAREAGADSRLALWAAAPFGLGLHVLRDLNWYTIEKAAVGWLALFAFLLLRAARRGGRWPPLAGLAYALMCWMNLYLGLVGAALGGLALACAAARRWRAGRADAGAEPTLPSPALTLRNIGLSCVFCAGFALPLVVAQALLMRGAAPLGTPEQFLWQRAALDSVTLSPLMWNRMEPLPALCSPLVVLSIWGLWRARGEALARYSAAAILVLTAISLGPALGPELKNPVYLALARGVPGLWRVAKPEVFFEGAFLLLLTWAALALTRLVPEGARRAASMALAAAMVAWFLGVVRAHPAYPGFSAPVESRLNAGWERRGQAGE